jgi:hypothetical protein
VLDYIWGSGIVLEVFVLARGLFSGNLKRFPYFYTYVASGAASSVCLIFIRNSTSFKAIYWLAQFITLFIGCGLILEIFSHVLSAYPGAEKFAKRVCVITFVLIFVVGLIYVRMAPSGTLAASELELEKNVRTAQIVFLLSLMAAIFYYGILLGKNMRGMLSGYGLYLGTSLISLALRSYVGTTFIGVWRIVQPFSFDVALLIWLTAIWAYHPDPAPLRDGHLESDYEALAALTKNRMNALRSHLGRSTRRVHRRRPTFRRKKR